MDVGEKTWAFLSTLEIEDKKLGLKNLGETNTTLFKNGGFIYNMIKVDGVFVVVGVFFFWKSQYG